MKTIKLFTAALFILVILMNISGCAAAPFLASADLTADITPRAVSAKPADDVFIANTANLAINLFKASVTEQTEKENRLISPLSIMLAAAMTANGADGQTLTQMEALLGGGIPLTELNEYLYDYVKNLPSMDGSRLELANSIWFRDDGTLEVVPQFLQTNADYYNAAVFASSFNDKTVEDVNAWVSENTEGMISKILTEIDPYSVMYLINATMFDAKCFVI